MSVAAYAAARQPSTPTECRHSKATFDTLFHEISKRRDVSPTAKLCHGRLVSLHRTQRAETQTQIGEALGLSRHQVWAGIHELVTAGLVLVIRYGLGRPNEYVLLGLDQDDIDGRAQPATGRRPVPNQHSGQSGSRARDPLRKEERGRMQDSGRRNGAMSQPIQAGECSGCGGPHTTRECQKYGRLIRS